MGFPILVRCHLYIESGPRGHLNIKMPSYQNRDPHVKDKMVLWLSYLQQGNLHTCKYLLYNETRPRKCSVYKFEFNQHVHINEYCIKSRNWEWLLLVKLLAVKIGIFWKNSCIWWLLMPCAPRSSATMKLTMWDKWVLVPMKKDFNYLCHLIV